MKKDIVLIVIIVAVLCIGAINTINAKEYVRDDYIITFSERCEWMWTGGDKLYSTPSDSEFHCDRRLSISIWVSESFKVPISDGHPISSLQDAIDFENELFDKLWNPEFEITNTYQMTTRNGYDVYVIECIPDSQCLEKWYYIPKGDGTTCIIECRTSNKYYDEMIRNICEPAVQSFKFTGEPTPTPAPTLPPDMQSVLEARRILYQNYGKCLNDYYWVERGTEMATMFADDFEKSFTTPLGILETFAKQIIIGGYSAVEILTKEVTSGTGTLNCYWMSSTLHLSKPEIKEPEQRMLHILELIEEEKYEEAKEEICSLRSVLTEWRDNIDTLHWTDVGLMETAGEANKKRAKNLLTAIIKFLDTEYATLGGEVIPGPMPTPAPTPNGPGFEAVFVIAMLLVVAYFLRRKVEKIRR
jgi:hypothetical protein